MGLGLDFEKQVWDFEIWIQMKKEELPRVFRAWKKGVGQQIEKGKKKGVEELES